MTKSLLHFCTFSQTPTERLHAKRQTLEQGLSAKYRSEMTKERNAFVVLPSAKKAGTGAWRMLTSKRSSDQVCLNQAILQRLHLPYCSPQQASCLWMHEFGYNAQAAFGMKAGNAERACSSLQGSCLDLQGSGHLAQAAFAMKSCTES